MNHFEAHLMVFHKETPKYIGWKFSKSILLKKSKMATVMLQILDGLFGTSTSSQSPSFYTPNTSQMHFKMVDTKNSNTKNEKPKVHQSHFSV